MHHLFRVFGYSFICGVVLYASKNVATMIDTSTDIYIQSLMKQKQKSSEQMLSWRRVCKAGILFISHL